MSTDQRVAERPISHGSGPRSISKKMDAASSMMEDTFQSSSAGERRSPSQ